MSRGPQRDSLVSPPWAASIFASSGCEAGWLVTDLGTGREIGNDPDSIQVAASTFKVFVALELCLQAAAGEIDPARRLHVRPGELTPGGSGLSLFEDPADLSLRDLAKLMMTISDNAATDHLIREVGLERINARLQLLGLHGSVVPGDGQFLLDVLAADLGFESYRQVLAAQSGQLGEEARQRSIDRPRIAASRAVDVRFTFRTTARDMVRLLGLVWRDEAGPAAACASLRDLMAAQIGTRIGGRLPRGHRVWCKSGTLFGVALNEVGVIEAPDARRFAAAMFTRAHRPFEGRPEIIRAIGEVTARAVEHLRG